MPTYEFRCPKCKAHLLETKGIQEDPPQPTCGECGEQMVRLYNFGAVTFKGSGFYKTDGK